MSEIPKWKTPKFKIVGYTWIGLCLLTLCIDGTCVILNKIMDFPTLSNYVSWRAENQFWFGLIIFIILVFFIFHFLGRWFKVWILPVFKKWF